MNEHNNDAAVIKLIVYAIIAYFLYSLAQAVTYAITELLIGLVHILLGVAGIAALYFLYRFFKGKSSFGEERKLWKVDRWQRYFEENRERVPEHMRDQFEEYCSDKQREKYNPQTHSKVDNFFDRTRQVVNIFRGKGE